MDVLHLSPADIVFFGDRLDIDGNDHAVNSVGIDTIAVRDPTDTEIELAALLAVLT